MGARADALTWGIAALASAGVLVRPWRLPEAIWAVLGALLLVLLGLLSPADALRAAARGTDVYLFLTGMMLLSEVARREGLFDFLAALAVRGARGSASRLFLLVYGVGTAVTALMSNDATAVVLTPAVLAAARAAGADPLPLLFACTFIANAASFLLPISNPANLVLYASQVPPLPDWLGHFILPSMASIGVTYAVLRWRERRRLRAPIHASPAADRLGAGGVTAALGIAATAAALLVASAAGWQLGLPTCLCGTATAAVVLVRKREAPWPVIAGVHWAVLPLVAGLFVLVQGLAGTGALAALAALLKSLSAVSATAAAWTAGAVLAVGCNLINNLPAGLIASTTAAAAQAPRPVRDALLIGVDLGPNLSITGSLATILWLVALRRDGLDVSFRRFLARGALVMPPALIAALAATLLTR
ncbi:MAG: arsenic transporter [Acidisphaera sp.]|nr:arsenic transporter [Acidisphaera sp.]